MNNQDEIERILAEFAWCENSDQKVGAMASEIKHLRATIEDLRHEIKLLLNKIYYGGINNE